MAPIQAPRYSLTELAGLAGVTPRTVRYYVAQGLLPSPGTSGPGAKYDDGHLDRLRLIRKLQREHLPLAEIRQRLAGLDDEMVATLADEPTATPAVAEDSALDYIRRVLGPSQAPPFRARSLLKRAALPPLTPPPPVATAARVAASAPVVASAPIAAPTPPPRIERAQWERIGFGPDIELHVRRPLPRPLAKKVDRLVSIARDLLEEDPS
ncbi:MAG TPA: MerR family transcriptional regulator [Candidatus Limnocylindrales bacterium]|nr:MerR family transcriptional regulator [Candidatus Limnocylindrales bacterium]